jgi:hypothetical protein
MKIRVHGTVDECRQMTALLAQVMTVQSVSDPYPDRGRSVLVRVYVEGIPGAARTVGYHHPGSQPHGHPDTDCSPDTCGRFRTHAGLAEHDGFAAHSHEVRADHLGVEKRPE